MVGTLVGTCSAAGRQFVSTSPGYHQLPAAEATAAEAAAAGPKFTVCSSFAVSQSTCGCCCSAEHSLVLQQVFKCLWLPSHLASYCENDLSIDRPIFFEAQRAALPASVCSATLGKSKGCVCSEHGTACTVLEQHILVFHVILKTTNTYI